MFGNGEKFAEGVQKMSATMDWTKKMNEIDRRAQRLNDRIKKRKSSVVTDDKNNKKTSNTATKKSRSGNHQATKLGREKEVSHNFADDESENDALEERNHSDSDWHNSQHENHMDGMTITHEKKDEVSVLSAPTQSTFLSFDNSVFNRLGKRVQSGWKLQLKGMLQIFGPVVRNKFMSD